MTIVTPYPDEVNEREKVFLEHLGYQVDEIRGLNHRDPKYIPLTQPQEIYHLAKAAWRPGGDALFISCTGLCILEVIPALEAELGVPVVTSNQASIWDIGEFFGAHGPRSRELGRLFTLRASNRDEVELNQKAM